MDIKLKKMNSKNISSCGAFQNNTGISIIPTLESIGEPTIRKFRIEAFGCCCSKSKKTFLSQKVFYSF
jgi:hypothetical protein